MKKHVLALATAAPIAALTACSSMPGIEVTQTPATETAKTEAVKAEETQSGGSKTEIPAPAADDKVYMLKISTSQTDQSLITQVHMRLTNRVKENPDGRLEIGVFPSSQLGNDEDVAEQAIQGVRITVNTDVAGVDAYVKDIGIPMMGYFADNYEEYRKIMKTGTSKDWGNELADRYGTQVLAFNFYDRPRHFTTSKGVKAPEDLKGLRVRTIGTEVYTEPIEAMGGTPIAMAWSKVYNGIQSETLDACEVQNTSTYPSRIYRVCKYRIKAGHFQFLQALVCGKSWLRSPPEDLQEILVDTARETGVESAIDALTEAENCEKRVVRAELTIMGPDVEAFETAMGPAYEKLGYTKLREQLYREIGKTN